MKLGEAVTLIVDTHGWDAFDDLKKLKRRDKSMKEAVKVVEEARKIRNVWQHRERKAPPTKEQIAKCIDEGLKMQEIARKLHRQDATIRSCINRYGLRERYKKYHSLYAPSIVTVAECAYLFVCGNRYLIDNKKDKSLVVVGITSFILLIYYVWRAVAA